MEKKIEEIILCQCESPEHMMLFRAIEGDDDVFVTFHLKKLPFLQRLKTGIKYIFGYTSRYGDFDELLLRPEDRCKFEKVVRYLNYDNTNLHVRRVLGEHPIVHRTLLRKN